MSQETPLIHSFPYYLEVAYMFCFFQFLQFNSNLHVIDFKKNFINLYTTYKGKSLLEYKNFLTIK